MGRISAKGAQRCLAAFGCIRYTANMNEYTVSLDWDEEAAKWCALNDDIPIVLEDASLDTLIYRVKLATPELLELNGKPHADIHLLFFVISSKYSGHSGVLKTF